MPWLIDLKDPYRFLFLLAVHAVHVVLCRTSTADRVDKGIIRWGGLLPACTFSPYPMIAHRQRYQIKNISLVTPVTRIIIPLNDDVEILREFNANRGEW
jgi:hypothetical protein